MPTVHTNKKSSKSSGKSIKAPKATLYQRYSRLPMKWKLYIWGSTFVVAWLADSLSNRIFDKNMIDEEAKRRVDIQLKKEQENADSK